MGKKAIRKKAPAKRWFDEEEVTDHFHHLMKDNSRTVDQIYSKRNDEKLQKRGQVKGIPSHPSVGDGSR
ncbi:hypothetical protein R6Q57_009500 [Mikania cordata]